MKRNVRVAAVSAGLLALGVSAAVALTAMQQARLRQRLLAGLESPDREVRRQAAWTAAELRQTAIAPRLIEQLAGREPDEGVREAYVYALGRMGDPAYFDALTTVIRDDPSGYVRCAAWLAAARADPQRTRARLAVAPPPTDPWDRIGQAQARVATGDVSGFEELLYRAEHGEAPRREVAARALYKWLRPLLDAAGRWPLDANAREGEIWPEALTAELRQRCAELPLAQIAADTLQHAPRSEQFRRNVWRLTRARERLAAVLFADAGANGNGVGHE